MVVRHYETIGESQQRIRAEKAEQAFRSTKTTLAAKEEHLERLLSISEVGRLERELATRTAARDALAASGQRTRDELKAMTRRRDKALDLYEARGALLDDLSREKKTLVAERDRARTSSVTRFEREELHQALATARRGQEEAQEALKTMTAARDIVSKGLRRFQEALKTRTVELQEARYSRESLLDSLAQRNNELGETKRKLGVAMIDVEALHQARAELKGKSEALAQITKELFDACKRAMDAERYAKTLVKALDDEVKAKGSHEERITTLEAIVRP